MDAPVRKPLHYTFGNHWHWVDLQWLWGYRSLSASVDDMLALVERTGVRGNVNFDGIGYEKLAAEAPDTLARLRAAVQDGRIEVVGASYGQPYGLFQGGESNVRQRVFGVRAVQRVLGVAPRAFWEEEFDFFPQLPQILVRCGFDAACLFFQWTWHTPVVPEEESSLVYWEGVDGSRLPALAKTTLCLHQWPEDFDGKLETAAAVQRPALVQWVELFPSPDWMCRSELLLPRLEELAADPRFFLRPGTLSEVVCALDDGSAPVRAYTMDDVFHGMSLGKNCDRVPRLSLEAEQRLLAAESIAALAGLFGRPYASWDVYPTWELEEAWRAALAAQHHDIHECEGLCGSVGKRLFEQAIGMAQDVIDRTLVHVGRQAGSGPGWLVFNALGWERSVRALVGRGLARIVRVRVPAFGYRWLANRALDGLEEAPPRIVEQTNGPVIARGGLEVEIDRASGWITQVRSGHFPEGVLDPDRPLLRCHVTRGGSEQRFRAERVDVHDSGVRIRQRNDRGDVLEFDIAVLDEPSRVEVTIVAAALRDPDPGAHAGLQTLIEPALDSPTLFHDTPYAVTEIRGLRNHRRKYPSGEWMTSKQWFETVRRPFSALSLVDLVAGDRGLLVVHDGSQAFFRTEHGVANLLHMYDPWDEAYCDNDLTGARLAFIPHGPLSHQDRARLAAEVRALPFVTRVKGGPGNGPWPAAAGPLLLDGPALLTAFYRESDHAVAGLDNHFAAGVRDPFVARVVEFNGEGGEVTLSFPGRGRAARTDLLGRVAEELTVRKGAPREGAAGVDWHNVTFPVGPREIATVMLDLEVGRQIPRNLDLHRAVWATVHRR